MSGRNIETAILLESLQDWQLAKSASFPDPVRIYTSSPMVVETLAKQGLDAKWADRLLPDAWPNSIGIAAGQATRRLQGEFNTAAKVLDWPDLWTMLALPLHSLLSSLVFKRAIVERFLNEPAGRHVIVGEGKLSSAKNGSLHFDFFDTLFSVVLEENEASLLRTPRRDISWLHKQIDRPRFSDRLLSLADVSLGNILFRLHKFALRGRILRFGRSGPRALVIRDNETIREIYPSLLARGGAIELLPHFEPSERAEPFRSLPQAPGIAAVLTEELHKQSLDISTGIIANIVAERIEEASRYWGSVVGMARAAADSYSKQNRPTVILSNTLGPPVNQAFASFARKKQIPTVLAEHGVSAGLTLYHSFLDDWQEPAHADSYLATATKPVEAFRQIDKLSSVKFKAIGLPKQARTVPLRAVQRGLVRRQLAAGPKDRVVIYLARSVQNNLRRLPYQPEDHEVHAHQRKMADQVMPRLRGVPVIKLYSTIRYRDADPMAVGFAAPSPVRTLKTGDFRYLRAAADLVILETPLSTLGWAMGARVPVVYLLQPSLPLTAAAQDALTRAVFTIDTSQMDWADKLVELVNQPDPTIAEQWAAMAEGREDLLNDWIFGPEHAGRNGAAAVVAAARSGAG